MNFPLQKLNYWKRDNGLSKKGSSSSTVNLFMKHVKDQQCKPSIIQKFQIFINPN